jgi:Zn2+/Cd2+-exporting ATPase
MSVNVKAKREYLLQNLCCVNCAAKIEREIGFVTGVESSILDFVSKRLIIEANSENEIDRIYLETTKIVKRIEPDVNIVEVKNIKESKAVSHLINDNNRIKVIKLVISILLLSIGMIFQFMRPLEFVLFFISYILVGSEVLLKAFNNIKQGNVFDENFLMAIATLGAFAIGQFPEGVSVMIFYQTGEFFQDIAVNNSRKSITALMDIRPEYSNLVVGNLVKKVLSEEINVGDIIVVKPGERIPLDGKIVEGNSTVDTSALTGEALPRSVKCGENVLSGFINNNGLLKIEVIKEFSNSTVSRILELTQNASIRKAPTEKFITRFAHYYTPAVVIISVVIAILPPIFISGATFSEWIYRALIFLVVSCPCALVISIPLGFFGGIGGASRHGILIKGSNYLEALNKAEIVVFDKTGTLTQGVFEVVQINNVNGIEKEDILRYAAYAESFSNHPIAVSILKKYNKEILKSSIERFEEIPGVGIKVLIDNRRIYIGNSKLMEMENINYEKERQFGTIIHVAIDGVYGGYIVIADKVKSNSKIAIAKLKEIGIKKTIMLTGDNNSIGMSVTKELNIDEFFGELLPEGKLEKLELIEKQKSKTGKLVFVGDGINDAPVLARADIGIAMGGLGSDAAIEAADIVIMNDDPYKLVTAIKIANQTKDIVWQNIIFALGIKAVVLVLGALGYATMWEAVFADVGVALIAVLNSMRAMKIKI